MNRPLRFFPAYEVGASTNAGIPAGYTALSVAIEANAVTGTLIDPNGPPRVSAKNVVRWFSQRYRSIEAGLASKYCRIASKPNWSLAISPSATICRPGDV